MNINEARKGARCQIVGDGADGLAYEVVGTNRLGVQIKHVNPPKMLFHSPLGNCPFTMPFEQVELVRAE